jgi:hypothetical protein
MADEAIVEDESKDVDMAEANEVCCLNTMLMKHTNRIDPTHIAVVDLLFLFAEGRWRQAYGRRYSASIRNQEMECCCHVVLGYLRRHGKFGL